MDITIPFLHQGFTKHCGLMQMARGDVLGGMSSRIMALIKGLIYGSKRRIDQCK